MLQKPWMAERITGDLATSQHNDAAPAALVPLLFYGVAGASPYWIRGKKFWFIEITGADSASFECLASSLARDKNQMWRQGPPPVCREGCRKLTRTHTKQDTGSR
jgi:hypothetical protein